MTGLGSSVGLVGYISLCFTAHYLIAEVAQLTWLTQTVNFCSHHLITKVTKIQKLFYMNNCGLLFTSLNHPCHKSYMANFMDYSSQIWSLIVDQCSSHIVWPMWSWLWNNITCNFSLWSKQQATWLVATGNMCRREAENQSLMPDLRVHAIFTEVTPHDPGVSSLDSRPRIWFLRCTWALTYDAASGHDAMFL